MQVAEHLDRLAECGECGESTPPYSWVGMTDTWGWGETWTYVCLQHPQARFWTERSGKF